MWFYHITKNLQNYNENPESIFEFQPDLVEIEASLASAKAEVMAVQNLRCFDHISRQPPLDSFIK